jgi:hypothetical protein
VHFRCLLVFIAALASADARGAWGCSSSAMSPNTFEAFLADEDEVFPVLVDDVRGRAIFGGDIDLGPSDEVRKQATEVRGSGGPDRAKAMEILSVGSGQKRWADGIVPYVIGASVTDKKVKADLAASVAHWNKLLGGKVKIQPRRNEARYVRVVQASGNTCSWSPRSHTLKLATGYVGCARHELGHVLGLWHEQMRHDREKYVRIFWANINGGSCSQFQQLSKPRSIGQYDLSSVMHYRERTALCKGKKTIEAIPPGKIGRRNDKITAGDVAGALRAQKVQ